MGVSVMDSGIDAARKLSRDNKRHVKYSSNSDCETAFLVYQIYNHVLMHNGSLDSDDRARRGCCIPEFYSMAALERIDEIPQRYRYDYIFVDEAQDITRTQIELVIRLKRKRAYIASDANQCIYGKKWSFDDAVPGHTISVKKLSKTFRCTKSIHRFAECLRSHNDYLLAPSERLQAPEPNTPEGAKPEIFLFPDRKREEAWVGDKVRDDCRAHPDWTIGVLCTTNQLCDHIGTALMNARVQFQMYSKEDAGFSSNTPGVKVLTVHSAKGLEFDTVYLPYFDVPAYDEKKDEIYSDSYNELKGRDLAYVAVTRARSNLIITYGLRNKHSRFLDEVDPSLYEFSDLTGLGTRAPAYVPPKIASPLEIASVSENEGAKESSKSKKRWTTDEVMGVLEEIGVECERLPCMVLIKDPLSDSVVKDLEMMGIRLKMDNRLKIWKFEGSDRLDI